MKPLTFLALLLSICLSSFAGGTSYNVKQNSWRWRNNDGSEATATWRAPQETPINYGGTNEVVRLRIEMINSSYSTANCPIMPCNQSPLTVAMADSLEYSTTPSDAASWKKVGLNAAQAFVIAGANSFVAQDDPTAARLTGSSVTFVAGKIMATDSVLKGINLTGNSRSEYEWAIKATTALADNTIYYFRQYRRYSTTQTTNYSIAYPTLTTGLATAVTDLFYSRGDVFTYPNPANSAIHFRLTRPVTGLLQARLCDLAGRPIRQQEFRNVTANSQQTIPLEGAPAPGIYILQLYGDRFRESVRVMIR